jgi:hypothetical protein
MPERLWRLEKHDLNSTIKKASLKKRELESPTATINGQNTVATKKKRESVG